MGAGTTLSLFGDEPEAFDREGLRARLAALVKEDIWIGTSSWKYEGWLGQIYTPERYRVRGRFSAKQFESDCLSEYAETFPIVCGDFSFYQFPSPEFWKKLFRSAPPPLKFALKVPEEITVKAFPIHPRYGLRAGDWNERFLDTALFQTMFLRELEAYRDRIAVLIFEFGAFPSGTYRSVAEFVDELDPFLSSLPPAFRYAVEIRTQEFLTSEYFHCLRRHGVAHVFNAWTRMPEIADQIAMPEAFTADFTVTRALLRKGRPYEEAVKKFEPYRETRDANPRTREALRGLIQTARERREPSYIFVNNRLEGNAPATIEAITG